ncbi:Ig-like domain-containing protein [Microbacterium sp. NPDC096154]|uniref:Ig-like domain-containing protein n=1 Tax=Microbacterium sp. NPDC096154 TaxID=3155549 RepID=UPI00331A02CD
MSWLRERRRTLAAGAVVAVAALGVTTMAVAYEGNPTTELDLHDGSVWITKQDEQYVGHFNNESRRLDGLLVAPTADYDVLQQGERLLVHDAGDGSLSPIDPAAVALGERVEVPRGARVELGGDTVAILDPESGALHVLPFAGVSSFGGAEAEPVLVLGAGADFTVASDGTVYAVAPESGTVHTVRLTPEGAPQTVAERELAGITATSKVAVTSVATTGGTAPVVLDASAGTLHLPERDVSVAGAADARLAADASTADPMPADANGAGSVLLATRTGLLRVPLSSGRPVETPTGVPAANPIEPVAVGGCAYGAWAESGRVLRDCPGDGDDLRQDIPDYDAAGELRFRVNRDAVVLNDVRGGGAWLPSETLQKVDNWEDVTPPEGEGETNDDKTTQQVPEALPPDRGPQNTDPVTKDDDFGVRAGQTTILPVLDNDSDPDGDVLTVSLPDGSPELGDVRLIHNDTALQIAVPADASGTDTFGYAVSDGRGGEAAGSVSLTVHGADRNAVPVQLPERTLRVPVEVGGAVTYSVLPEWRDPDGDSMYLVAVHPLEGDEVTFTADGRITYRALSGTQGPVEVPVEVSDGLASAAGVLSLDVRPRGSTPPVTTADHVITRAGQQATVAPLANDLSAGAEPLRLARVDEVQGAVVTPDFPNRSFSFRSDTPGTYYVQYLASTGPNAVPGLVRIDVRPPTQSDLPPVAVRDVALLPAGGEVLVDVLANDADPGGGVLVVQSIVVEEASGLSVSVLAHQTLRIGDRAMAGERATIRYTMSNGSQSAEGEVVVISVPGADKLRPPVVADDEAVVRAGDVVTIPVLDNDTHPNGDELHLLPELDAAEAAEMGEMFVSQDRVRFRAGDEPGTVYATYEAVDSVGERDAGVVSIQILPVDEEANAAPRPKDLVARALSGRTATVVVPLDGIDPDGDSVELDGLESAPTKGTVSQVDGDRLEYVAQEGATGVDTFSYRVRDRLGQSATATVRIGIAPASDTNQAPFAVRDDLRMRPGRVVSVPVLENDSDPEGGRVGVVENGLILPEAADFTADVPGPNRVDVTAPEHALQDSFQYTIQDELGAEALGVVQVTVDPDVPAQAPIARDDRVRVEDVTPELTADVDLLANDEDPDGTARALEIAVDGDAQPDAEGILRVTLDEHRRLIGYTLTDQDGQTARAFVRVPGVEDLRPTLTDTEPVEVRSGETIELPLADHVESATGREVRLTEADRVRASHSDGSSLFRDESTLVYTSLPDYVGADAVSFEVTDGASVDDPAGRKATLAIPITVLPPDNAPPTFVDAELAVGEGDPEPATLDLGALATDANPEDRLRFELGGAAPDGVNASIDGTTLAVTAEAGRKGLTGDLVVRVSDDEADPVEGHVRITVTSSTAERATVTDDTVPEAAQGETVTVSVLANDRSPFPGEELRVVDASVQTGRGAAELDGDSVRVTPAADFLGTMVVVYRVQDATKDPSREVSGRITLTVKGAPDAPGTPTPTSVQDRRVLMSWTPPPSNGSPITHYVVTSQDGEHRYECPTSTCALTGLTNNVEYRFQVVAVNGIGESVPSPLSEAVRPDVRPDTPVPPTVPAFGDRSLRVAWVEPHSSGSPVTRYTLEVQPALANGISQIEVTETNPKETFRVVEGLRNGTAYRFRVRAHNDAPEPSSWSGWSPTGIPATVPGAPTRLEMGRGAGIDGQAQMTIRWLIPSDDGGDAIQKFEVRALLNGDLVKKTEVSGGTTEATLVIPVSTTDYTFEVRAKNKAGWSEPLVGRTRAMFEPGAPTGVTATPGDRQISVSWTAGALNGASASWVDYQFSLNGGAWSGGWASGGTQGATKGVIGGLSNGTSYTVRIRAVSHPHGERQWPHPGEGSAASKAVTPSGPPRAPTIRAEVEPGVGAILVWSVDATGSADGSPVREIILRLNGAEVYRGSDTTPTYEAPYAEDTRYELSAQVVDANGAKSAPASHAVTGPPPGTRTYSAVRLGCDAAGANCTTLGVELTNMPLGTTWTFSCYEGAAGAGRQFGSSVSFVHTAHSKRYPLCAYSKKGGSVYVVAKQWSLRGTDPIVWK